MGCAHMNCPLGWCPQLDSYFPSAFVQRWLGDICFPLLPSAEPGEGVGFLGPPTDSSSGLVAVPSGAQLIILCSSTICTWLGAGTWPSSTLWKSFTPEDMALVTMDVLVLDKLCFTKAW